MKNLEQSGIKISLIAAIGQNRELGARGKLLWHIPEDMKRFKELTTGHPVIMGRKTFESIGRPLPNRLNIVITRNPDYQADGCLIASSVEDAIAKARTTPYPLLAKEGGKEVNAPSSLPARHSLDEGGRRGQGVVFVIGGGQIYKEALPYAQKIYLTVVEQSFPQADTFFPEYGEFSRVVSREDFDNGQYKFSFLELTRPLTT